MAESIASKAVISTATWIDKLVSTALVVAIVVVATKITAGAKFKIPGIDVEFDTGYTWVIFTAFTLAHLYVTVLFIKACRTLFRTDYTNAKPTWEELTRSGPLLFRGLMPRLLPQNGRIAVMRWDDPTTWLAHGGAVLFFAAIIPFSSFSLLSIATALIITLVNWILGSNWVIAASELTCDPGKTRLL